MQYKGQSKQQSNGKMSKLDLEIGDVVRIRENANQNVGDVGVIIGIRLAKGKSGNPLFVYTVKLSDASSVELDAYKLDLIS